METAKLEKTRVSNLPRPDPGLHALGEIGPQAKAALPALAELANDPDRRVGMQVVNSLRSIDPKNYSGLKNETSTSP